VPQRKEVYFERPCRGEGHERDEVLAFLNQPDTSAQFGFDIAAANASLPLGIMLASPSVGCGKLRREHAETDDLRMRVLQGCTGADAAVAKQDHALDSRLLCKFGELDLVGFQHQGNLDVRQGIKIGVVKWSFDDYAVRAVAGEPR